jgi:monofunctional biosynthetic peptidoglycan transglycosylase
LPQPVLRKAQRKKSRIGRLVTGLLLLIGAYYIACIGGLLYLKVLPPLTTGVQIQRRIEAIAGGHPYHKRYRYIPLSAISRDLPHAIVAAEDGRFYTHHGFDWKEIEKVAEQSKDEGKVTRGASTISQQLVKNLFLTTHRNPIRKGIEITLTPLAELILGKQRILELYVNVIEWGPGVYGAEAAAETWYRTSAARLTRDQCTRLAAIIPAPRRRRPARMNDYSAAIQDRMRKMGW